MRRIHADRATVFNLLAEVELWPALFPHIRSSRVLRRDGRRRLIVVRTRWHGLPLGYTAIQTVDTYYYWMSIGVIGGLTNGSSATFVVKRAPGDPDAVVVEVDQRVVVPVPLVGEFLARSLVGGRVARDLGEAMLDRLKEVAEGGSLADRR
jgi:hypothetical protein